MALGDDKDYDVLADSNDAQSSPPTPEAKQLRVLLNIPYPPELAKMAKNQVFIDGTFDDLADELASYIDNVTKVEEAEGVRAALKPLLEAKQKDEALKKLITASRALNAAPEREFTAAYNLLVYLVLQSPNVNMFLPKVCENLSRPITSSPANSSGLSLSVLTTLFNLLDESNAVRYHVFASILGAVKKSGLFEMLRPELEKLSDWFALWKTDDEDQRIMLVQIADVAEEAGEPEYVSVYPASCRTCPTKSTFTNFYRAVNHTSISSALSAPSRPMIPLPSLLRRPPTSPSAPSSPPSSPPHTSTSTT